MQIVKYTLQLLFYLFLFSQVSASSEDPNSETQQDLRDLLRQRDDEISVLLKILKQEKRKTADAEASLKRSGGQQMSPSTTILDQTGPVQLEPGVRFGIPSGGVQSRTDYAEERDVCVRQSQESVEWKSAMKTSIVHRYLSISIINLWVFRAVSSQTGSVRYVSEKLR